MKNIYILIVLAAFAFTGISQVNNDAVFEKGNMEGIESRAPGLQETSKIIQERYHPRRGLDESSWAAREPGTYYLGYESPSL